MDQHNLFILIIILIKLNLLILSIYYINLDVIEMDAASKTGVDDVREIIDNVKYKPVNSLFKIFLFETIPTLKPAKSNLFFEYIPGISAVSPPISLQLEILQPFKIPLRMLLVFLSCNFPRSI